MGTDIALREKTDPVPDTPTNRATLKNELREYAGLLDVERRLHAFGTALHATESAPKNAHYFLLRLDPTAKQLLIKGYSFGDREQAASDYLEAERSIEKSAADAVLVSVESLEALRRAYPNYFLDTDVFIGIMKKAIE